MEIKKADYELETACDNMQFEPPARSSRIESLVRGGWELSRPLHWTKNVFVLAPLPFSGNLLDQTSFENGVFAFIAFCFWSSCVYAINDVIDVNADRQHPRKSARPVASGQVSVLEAIGLASLWGIAGTLVAMWQLPNTFLLAGLAYAVNSLAYCLLLKHRVIADVFSIAAGFVIRLLAGCAAIGVTPSSWLLICGFTLALSLAFGKRRAEYSRSDVGGGYRRVLDVYSKEKLDFLLAVSTAVCLVAYLMFTVAPDTISRHETDKLYLTFPFVAYGLFRFVLKSQEGAGDGPVDVLVRDPVFFLNGLCWMAVTLWILHVK